MQIFRILGKGLKWIGITLLTIMVLFFIVRFVGQRINLRTPEHGINESMYVDINGTRQWISIYGEDINNPVLLYLHGGPGSSTSQMDYAFTRKWADIYTVVTWDQRNCGKSYDKAQNNTKLTHDLMLSDGVEMTKFLLKHLKKEKITLLGHSWGTYLGSNLALEYPMYYEAYIGTGQMVDFDKNEEEFRKKAIEWSSDDQVGMALVDRLVDGNYDMDYYRARNELMERYGYDMMADGTDLNLASAVIFNPYYSIGDFIKVQFSDFGVYMDFISSDEFKKFSLLGRTHYEVPYFNINGDKDYQTNYLLAQEYFDEVSAPEKKMYIMKDTTHGLLEAKSDKFSQILHEVRKWMTSDKSYANLDKNCVRYYY